MPYGSYLSCGLKTQNFCHRKTRTDSGTSERNGVICDLQALPWVQLQTGRESNWGCKAVGLVSDSPGAFLSVK